MERGSTKQKILDAALDLFSTQGFEATSIAQIAEAVGIRKASLYSHFARKQAILDAIVETVLARHAQHSIFARQTPPADAGALTPDAAAEMILGQVRYVMHDPRIRKARMMLMIEQFRNPELAALLTRQNYTEVMRSFTALIERLIGAGVLADDDPAIMAAQLCLPITTWINLCDREPDREQEVMELVRRHIHQFFRLYQPKAR